MHRTISSFAVKRPILYRLTRLHSPKILQTAHSAWDRTISHSIWADIHIRLPNQDIGDGVITEGSVQIAQVNGDNGSLNITNGTAAYRSVTVAESFNTIGALSVTGSNTLLKTDLLVLSSSGSASGSINAGARVEIHPVNQNWVYLGNGMNGSGSLSVTGTGSSLVGGLDPGGNPTKPQIMVGGNLTGDPNGTGQLYIGQGGLVEASNIVIGGGFGTSNNTVMVMDPTSRLVADSLTIAENSGQGTFFVGNGATAEIGGPVNVGPAADLYVVNALLHLTGSQPITLNGRMHGSGVVQAKVENVGGIVNPSTDPDAPQPRTAILQIDGDYRQHNTGTLAIDLAGTTPGSLYDRLTVSGAANLDGTLNVELQNGFIPQNTDSFTILSAGAVSGTFANAPVGIKYLAECGRFDIAYSATDVTLSNYAPPVDCYWTSAVNGVFGNGIHWTPSGPPELPDRAIFNQSTAAYTVTFDADHTNNRLLVDAGNVTLNLNGHTYSVQREWSDTFGQSVMIAQSPGSYAKLTVANGNVFAKDCKIGVADDAIGELVIDTGAQWSALQHAIVIGDEGRGTLSVQNGGQLINGHGWAGGLPYTGNGQIYVSGVGSKWSVTGWFGLGQQGTGELSVSDKGSAEMGVCQMANDADAEATASIYGKGSVWSLQSPTEASLVVGNYGMGTVNAYDGAAINNAGDLHMALQPGSTGMINVIGKDPTDGTPSTLEIGRDLVVGGSGRGDLDIDMGGIVKLHGNCNVGNSYDGAGYILVNGAGSMLDMSDAGPLTIGAGGMGMLSIKDGGNVSNVNAFVNSAEGSQSEVDIDGPGSKWILSDAAGTSLSVTCGKMVVSNGGLLDNAGHLHIGVESGGPSYFYIFGGGLGGGQVQVGGTMVLDNGANVEVGGPDANLIVKGRGAGDPNDHVGLEVGRSSWANLRVSGGAFASNNYITTIGAWEGGSGNLTISGTGSLFQANYQLEVGRNGQGTVIVKENGKLEVTGTMTHEIDPDISNGSTGLGLIGLNGIGLVMVQTGGEFSTVKQLQVGVNNTGRGSLIIEDGGIVESHKSTSATESSGILGVDAGSMGNVTVSGTNSRWTQDGVLNIGWSGNGDLNIGAGGLVESQKGVIGRFAGSTGNVLISGANARWAIAEELHVGGKPFGATGGAATMKIENGGTVQVGSNINIWTDGKLSIADDGNLGSIPSSIISDYFNFGGGTLAATDNLSLNANRGLSITSAGGTFEVATDKTMTILGPATGDGYLVKNGKGALVLAGTPSYLGPTAINDGLLRIEASANMHAISGLGNLGIGSGGTPVAVTADSVNVNVVTLSIGSRLTINPIPGGPVAGINPLIPVPEPSTTITLLAFCAIAALFRRYFSKL